MVMAELALHDPLHKEPKVKFLTLVFDSVHVNVLYCIISEQMGFNLSHSFALNEPHSNRAKSQEDPQ